MTLSTETYTLENFEGPLDLLFHLINKDELDITQIALKQLVEQFLSTVFPEAFTEDQRNFDKSADFIALAASLVWLKAKALLPNTDKPEDEAEERGADPHFEIIHHLVDYCRFKKAALELTERELQQEIFYSRAIDPTSAKKNFGIDHLSLDDLAVLFQQIIAKAKVKSGVIYEEEWKVADKIALLTELLNASRSLLFSEVFYVSLGRTELIVTFLALLEMMKSGKARVVLDKEKNTVYILGNKV